MNAAEKLRTWAAAALVAALLYVCFFSHLSALGLIGPDEPRYTSIAREMRESGDWVTPRLNGQPWFEKPVLYYWAAAVSFRMFGVNEFAARLPSSLAATLATFALFWLARKTYGRAVALAVMFIFPTCVGVFGFARAATSDMLFSSALAFAMVFAYEIIWREPESLWKPRLVWQGLLGALLGTAVLAKGPAAILLAGGSCFLWALTTMRWKLVLRLLHPIVVLTFCVVALPWYVLCALRNPAFVPTFLMTHNVERFLTPVFQHVQPFWYYGPILALGLVPWTLLLAGTFRDGAEAWKFGSWRAAPGYFFACWAFMPVLFFSLSKSKLPGYVLPCFAPLALLLGHSLVRALDDKRALERWLPAGVGLTLIVLVAAAGHWLDRLPPEAKAGTHIEVVMWTLAGAAAGLGVFVLGLRRRPWAALVLAMLLMGGLIEGAGRVALPRLDARISPRETARLVVQQAPETTGVALYQIHRAWQYGLNFYLRRELPIWQPDAPQAPRPKIVVTSLAGLRDLQSKNIKMEIVREVGGQVWIISVKE